MDFGTPIDRHVALPNHLAGTAKLGWGQIEASFPAIRFGRTVWRDWFGVLYGDRTRNTWAWLGTTLGCEVSGQMVGARDGLSKWVPNGSNGRPAPVT